ncbi:hypothetical protein N7490_010924 [Penicillium lividum]|nr:hypothetical protein N7490_010924 [Penicillium lividum]
MVPRVGRGHGRKTLTSPLQQSTEEDSQQPDPAASSTTTGAQPKPGAPEFVHGTLPKTKSHYIAGNLPPMSNIEDIFTDLAQKALSLGLNMVIQSLNGRPLRVATMCSGTESPLFALQMIQQALNGLSTDGKRFRVEHAFSCEIVPFKQAYIERNFEPPLLFRDICQMGGVEAQTAYGTLAKIPGDVDILIAGTACVDFSRLNVNMDANNESGESISTFNGMLMYCSKYRPRLVICENVIAAPWGKFENAWSGIGYSAKHATLDSKHHYMPQTRQRGYLVAVDEGRLNTPATDRLAIPLDALNLIPKFRRPCSSPTSSFLLGADDRKLEQIEKDLSNRLEASSSRAEVAWDSYKMRHQKCRDELPASDQRPISRSNPGGKSCQGPDYFWCPWFKLQVERVMETLDIKFLTSLSLGFDFQYKERYIDLSQGVGRSAENTTAFGTIGCLTPSGMPFSTVRGGPLTGLEALALQGLPIDRMILSHESSRELQDLAGNAMTTTVVGTVMLSALIAARSVLEGGAGNPTLQADAGPKTASPMPTVEVGHNLAATDENHNCTVDGSGFGPILLAQSVLAARYCACERQSRVAPAIVECQLCGHTACSSCAGNPPHAYEPKVFHGQRIQPLEFDKKLRKILPMRLRFGGVGAKDLKRFEHLKRQILGNAPDETWEQYISSIQSALLEEVRFTNIKRTEVWTVFFEGEFASLRLEINGEGVQWLLFAKAHKRSPAQCVLREILAKPIARMRPETSGLFGGVWEVLEPISTEFALRVSGSGSQVPSYLAECGLLGSKHTEPRVWSHLEIDCDQTDVDHLDHDLRGTYDLLADCGTAGGSLHKKKRQEGMPPVYLFLDPRKAGPIMNDSFVFSVEHRRNPGYEVRRTVAELPPIWRPVSAKTHDKTSAYARRFHKVPGMDLGPSDGERVFYRHLDLTTDLFLRGGDCHKSYIPLASLSADDAVTLGLAERQITPINPERDPNTFQGIAWALQQVGDASSFHKWRDLGFAALGASCQTCKPAWPKILWSRDRKGKAKPHEDPQEAAAYERAVKSKPPPFMIFTNVEHLQDRRISPGELQVAVNLQSMVHSALGKLVDFESLDGVQFSWRLVSNAYDMGRQRLPAFVLPHNQADVPHAQPPNFKQQLRTEQLRSLHWMITQEADDIRPFIEEETEEALCQMMAWRADVKVLIPRLIRGGLVADEVGFGKTATVLGLIDSQYKDDKERLRNSVKSPINLLATNATLIVVPPHLRRQWGTEIDKFLGTKYRVVEIPTMTALWKVTIEDIQDADIVLVSSGVLTSAAYFDRLRSVSGVARVPMENKGARVRDLWFRDALNSLRDLLVTLNASDPERYLEELVTRHQRWKDNQEASTYEPSRRFKGKAFTANEKKLREEKERQDAFSVPDPKDLESESKPEVGSKVEEAEREAITKELRTLLSTTANKLSKMKAPTLHAFDFNRLVIDEFTSSDEEKQLPIMELSARSKWILSATPDLDDFADVKSIARHLGVHLGIDDDADVSSHNKRLKAKKSQLSNVEKFLTYSVPHSNDWYQSRNLHAQRFLNQFSRQNIAEIDQISLELHIILSEQSDTERYQYEVLYNRIRSENGRLRRIHNPDNDLSLSRLNDLILSSKSPVESLLKASITSKLKDHPWRISACNSQLNTLAKGYATRYEKLQTLLRQYYYFRSRLNPSLPVWNVIIDEIQGNEYGDGLVQTQTANLISELHAAHNVWMNGLEMNPPAVPSKTDHEIQSQCEEIIAKHRKKAEEVKPRKKTTAPTTAPTTTADTNLDETLNENFDEIYDETFDDDTHNDDNADEAQSKPKKRARTSVTVPILDAITQSKIASNLRKPLTTDTLDTIRLIVKNRRNHRFHVAMLALQDNDVPPCSNCRTTPNSILDLTVLRSCGHILCKKCLELTATSEVCIIGNCTGSATKDKHVKGSELNSQDIIVRSSKLTSFIELIHSIPDDEKVIVFEHKEDILKLIVRALELEGVPYITPKTGQAEKSIDEFIKDASPFKVLVLPLGGAMAAGLNLQCANHVVFVSPLYTTTQHDYEAGMKQAIGRARRYGQKKTVHVYHMLVKFTAEVNVFEERQVKRVIERDGYGVLLEDDAEHEEFDIECTGDPFEWEEPDMT